VHGHSVNSTRKIAANREREPNVTAGAHFKIHAIGVSTVRVRGDR